MKLPNHGRRAVALLYGLLLLTVPAIYGQTPTTGDKNTQSNEPARGDGPSASACEPCRLRSLSVMDNGHHHEHHHRVQGELRLELHHYFEIFRPRRRSGFRNADLAREPCSPRKCIFNRLRYDKVTNEYWGTDDPTTSNDERSHYTATENTKARLFDVPVLLHRNVRSIRLPFASLSLRRASRCAMLLPCAPSTTSPTRTALSANNQNRAPVDKQTLLGATVGAGFRFVDEFNIKVTPEVRFTRWNGATFNQDSTRVAAQPVGSGHRLQPLAPQAQSKLVTMRFGRCACSAQFSCWAAPSISSPGPGRLPRDASCRFALRPACAAAR